MGIAANFAEVDHKYRGADRCLEAARKFVELVGSDFERSLIVVSQASKEEKFLVSLWPFHTSVIGYGGGTWFGGSPGSSELYCEPKLEDLMTDLANEFGGFWPSASEIERAIIDGKKELEIYAEDWVC